MLSLGLDGDGEVKLYYLWDWLEMVRNIVLSLELDGDGMVKLYYLWDLMEMAM
jgi:hypothetical protein